MQLYDGDCERCGKHTAWDCLDTITHTGDTWCSDCLIAHATGCPKCEGWEETERMISDGQCRDCLLEEYKRTNGPKWYDDRALELGLSSCL
jgi:hypothetical protein